MSLSDEPISPSNEVFRLTCLMRLLVDFPKAIHLDDHLL